jgi:hypothetical protein
LEKVSFPSRRLLKLVDIAFHVLGRKEHELRAAHPPEVGRLRLEIVRINPRLHMRRHLSTLTADLLRDLREDRGETRDANLLRSEKLRRSQRREQQC